MTTKESTRRGLDEVDVMLLDALHANPRVSFEKLGPVLGISPATAARRWQRLTESGRAWVSSVPGPHLALVAAVYEVRTMPGRTLEVARDLAAIPQVVSVYATDGATDLTALVVAGDMPTLGTLLLERLSRVPGIAGAASHVGIEWYSGIHWRLGAIDSDQKRSVTDESDSGDRPAYRVRVFDPADRQLFLALQRDGRARYRDLAREVGTSEYLVRRQLDTLMRRGMLAFRTDFARSEGGWPAQFVLRLAAPPDRLADLGAEIGAWPTTRICLSAVGPANLLVVAQVHRIGDLTTVLDRIRPGSHDVAVVDQRLVLRVVKSWGRLVGADGRATGVVPVDPWAPLTRGG